MSAGYDKLNVKRLEKENVRVSNARGVYSEAIAEYIIAYLLYSLKDIDSLKQNQDNKLWDRETLDLQSLLGANVFYLGTGSIAHETVTRLKAFKTQNMGFNSDGRKIDGFDECIPLKDLKKHIHKADIVIASLPSNQHTHHLMDGEMFKMMKKGSLFINVGRGSLVDEASIQNHTNHLRHIILDVFEKEPLSEDSFLWDEDNVVITPHSSFISKHNELNQINLALENLENIKNNKDLKNQIL